MVYWVTAYLMLYTPLHLTGGYIAHRCVEASQMVRSEGAMEGIIRKWVHLGSLPLSTLSFEILCNTTDSNLSILVMYCISCYHRLRLLAIPCNPGFITESSLCSTICLRNVS